MSATPNINPAKVIGNVLNKFDATAAPTVNDDTSTGFSVGSKWIDVTNDKAYNCVDATTGAAVWNEAGGGGTDTNMANTNLTLDANRSHNTDGFETEYKRTTSGRNEWFLNSSNSGVSAQWLGTGNFRPNYATNSLILGAHGSTASVGWSTSDFQNKTFMVSGYAGDHIDVYRGVNWDVYTSNAGLTSLVRRMRMNSSVFDIYLDTLIKGSNNSAATSGFKVTDVNDLSLLDIKNDGEILIGYNALNLSTSSNKKLNTIIGYGANAINSNIYSSTAIGNNATVKGPISVAIGYNAISESTGSIAVLGQATKSSSIAIGQNSISSGNLASIAIGSSASATYNNAIALGGSSVSAGNFAVAIGNAASATGHEALVIGKDSISVTSKGIALGVYTEVKHINSIVLGSGVGNTSGNRLESTSTNQLTVGFNTTSPTMVIGATSDSYIKSTGTLSLETNTVVKGSNNASGTSGFKVTDVNDNSLLDVQNNGQTYLGNTVFNPLILNYNGTGAYGIGLDFNAQNSASNTHNFARIIQIATSISSGSENGALQLRVSSGGTITTQLLLRHDRAEFSEKVIMNKGFEAKGITTAYGGIPLKVLNSASTSLFEVHNDGTSTFSGTVNANAFVGDGSGLTNLPSGTDTNIANTDLTFDAAHTADINDHSWQLKDSTGINRLLLDFQQGTGNGHGIGYGGAAVDGKHTFYNTSSSSTVALCNMSYLNGLKLSSGALENDYLNFGSAGFLLHIKSNVSYGSSIGVYPDITLRTRHSSFGIVLDTDNYVKFKKATVEHSLIDSSSRWILRGSAVIGSEKISLQDDTLIKGSDSAAATSGFKVTDINNASLLDVRNNGQIGYGGSYNATVGHFFKNPTNAGTVAGFRHQDGSAILNVSNTNRNLHLYSHTNQDSLIAGQWGNDSRLDFYHKGTQLIRLNNGTLNYFNIPSMIFGGNVYIGTEDFSIQGDTLVKGSDNLAATSGFKVTGLNNAVSLNVTNDGSVSSISTSSVPSFTAKSDGTTDGYIQLNCTANTHGIKLKSPPHSAAASYTLTFPNDTGSNGQFLKTDGSGVLSWGAAGSSSPLTTKGDVYTYDTADARLPVGTNGQALVADSTEATGLKWKNLSETPAVGGGLLVDLGFPAANQVITTGAGATNINFDDSVTNAVDKNGDWDNTNKKFVVSSTSGSGTYQFEVNLFCQNTTGAYYNLQAFIGGVLKTPNGAFAMSDAISDSGFDGVAGIISLDLDVGDEVEIKLQALGSASTTVLGTGSWAFTQGMRVSKTSGIKGEKGDTGTGAPVSLTKTIILEAPADADYIPIFRTDVAITIQEALGGLMAAGDVDIRLYWDTDLANTSPTAIGAQTTLTSTTEAAVDISTDPTIPANSWIFLDIGTVATAATTVVNIRYTE